MAPNPNTKNQSLKASHNPTSKNGMNGTTSSTSTSTSSLTNNNNNAEASREMCYYCFEVLLNELIHPNKSKSNNNISYNKVQSQLENISCPLFVTWDKKKETATEEVVCSEQQDQGSTANQFDLRGCIGTLSPRPLDTALGEYAVISAFKDSRFKPITITEIPYLRVAVSLLVKYEDCKHCFDW